ncbi:MAG: 2-oxo acid dehydrogenase subunit E2 [Anaerolineae bacterium]
MPTEVVMPRLGLNMKEGLLVKWLAGDGERVEKGQPLFVVETDKVTNQVEAEVGGILHHVVREGSSVPVAGLVAYILQEGEALPSVVQPAVPQPGVAQPLVPPGPSAVPTQPVRASPAARRRARELGVDLQEVMGTGPGGAVTVEDVERHAAQKAAQEAPLEVRATPAARHLAQELGVDLTSVTPSGPGGRITREDVERAVREAAPAPAEIVPLEGVRAVIAQRMHRSLQETAQVTLTTEVDATNLVQARSQVNATREKAGLPPLSYNAILVKVVAVALSAFPYMNAIFMEGAIHRHKEVNVGVAVDTERGLLVPVIRHADRKSIVQIDAELRALAERALAGQSTLDDLSGGTFTITNLGTLGVDVFTPILNYPEVAILGVGRIAPKPVVYQGGLYIRERLPLSLTFDHRLVDGAPAARFLQRVGDLIESLRPDLEWWT